MNPPGLGWHTDIPQLRAGKVGGQVKFTFGAMNRSCMSKLVTDFFLMHSFGLPTWAAQLKDLTLQEPLWTRLMSSNYSSKSTQTHSSFATSSSDIASALKSNRIASLVGIEGGHAIDSSLGTLRQFYDLGARYMTLTHVCNTPW